MNNIYVFGHKKPDTDAVTSAIALSYLKNELNVNTKPMILDHINKETEFVLKYFKVEVPEYLEDVKLQIKDVNYHKNCYVNYKESIIDTYNYMTEKHVTGVPVVDEKNKFIGLLTSKMIGNELINGDFKYISTSYNNILAILKGEEILKFNNEIKGSATIPSNNLDNYSDIIITNNPNDLEDKINNNIKLIIFTSGSIVDDIILRKCLSNRINVIKTHYDLFSTTKVLNLANYVKILLSDTRNISFNENDYYEDFKQKSVKLGYNNYPVINDDGICLGLIRITDINSFNRKKVILVDHNDKNQSVYGLDEADVLEIVDHHNLGTLTTSMPINFRSMTVGSTNTIVYSMFVESDVEIPSNIAGIMLSGIISDTLKFTSPTTTEFDIYVAKVLAKLSNIDIDSFATEMFKEGTVLKGKSVDEIIQNDIKTYEVDDKKFTISQVITLSSSEILNKKDEYIFALNSIKNISSTETVLLCVTNILKKGSYLFFDESSTAIIASMFGFESIEEGYFFENCLSRKKQLVPLLMNALKK